MSARSGLRGACLLFAVLLASGAGRAAAFGSASRGTAAASFLKLGAGARAASMGEAYSAVADDAEALYWNPAGLASIETRAATFTHAAYLESSSLDYLAYGQKLGSHQAWGIGAQYFSAGSLTQTDAVTGADVGNFAPRDTAISLGYAYRFSNGSALGATGKFIQSKIIDSAQTPAADLGAISPAWLGGRARVSAGVANFGGSLKFDRKSESLPLTIRVGGRFQVAEPWLLALDLAAPKDNGAYAALGTEYALLAKGKYRFALRAGYNTRTSGDVSGFSGFSMGFGFGVNSLGIDYGFVPLGDLGATQRISLSYKL